MAELTAKTINELPEASSLSDSDLFVVSSSGSSKKTLLSTIKSAISSAFFPLSIANGGTGASTEANARANLSLKAKTNVVDIGTVSSSSNVLTEAFRLATERDYDMEIVNIGTNTAYTKGAPFGYVPYTLIRRLDVVTIQSVSLDGYTLAIASVDGQSTVSSVSWRLIQQSTGQISQNANSSLEIQNGIYQVATSVSGSYSGSYSESTGRYYTQITITTGFTIPTSHVVATATTQSSGIYDATIVSISATQVSVYIANNMAFSNANVKVNVHITAW